MHPLSYTSLPIQMMLSETATILASGTGFIYEYNSKPYLITNWHNVSGKNPLNGNSMSLHGGIPDTLIFPLIVLTEKGRRWRNFSLNLYDKNQKSDWLIHPVHGKKVDVVAIEIEMAENLNIEMKPINGFEFDKFELEVADDVFILGYPYKLNAGGHFPIWKKGSVASEPDIDLEGLPKILVDTASKKGMSGSPVIYRRDGIHGVEQDTLSDDTIFGTIWGFVGIYSGRLVGESDLDAQLGIVWKGQVIDEIIQAGIKDNLEF